MDFTNCSGVFVIDVKQVNASSFNTNIKEASCGKDPQFSVNVV